VTGGKGSTSASLRQISTNYTINATGTGRLRDCHCARSVGVCGASSHLLHQPFTNRTMQEFVRQGGSKTLFRNMTRQDISYRPPAMPSPATGQVPEHQFAGEVVSKDTATSGRASTRSIIWAGDTPWPGSQSKFLVFPRPFTADRIENGQLRQRKKKTVCSASTGKSAGGRYAVVTLYVDESNSRAGAGCLLWRL